MAVGWLLCSLWVLGGWVTPAVGHSLFSCEPIMLRMCQDLPYNTTFMPNLLNHYDQQTAALAMEFPLDCDGIIPALPAVSFSKCCLFFLQFCFSFLG